MHAFSTRTDLWKAHKLIAKLLITIISFFGDGPGLQRAEGFSAASAAASERQVPMIVFVHGSDWNGLGQRLHAGM